MASLSQRRPIPWPLMAANVSRARRRSYSGACRPGDASHSLMCEPVSACRALRISASRAAPGGSALAFSRSRFASSASRISSGEDWMILRRGAMVILQPMNSRPTYNDGSGSRKSGTCDRQNGEKRKLVMNGHVTERAYSFSSVQVCAPHSHLNMRTILPFCGLSIFKTERGFLPHSSQGLTGFGSKPGNTSFLKSRSTAVTTPSSDTKYHSAHSFQKLMSPEEYFELAERYRVALETATDIFTRHHLEAMEHSYRT